MATVLHCLEKDPARRLVKNVQMLGTRNSEERGVPGSTPQ